MPLPSVNHEEIFQESDVNKDGSLSYDELAGAMRQKGYTGTKEELKTIFASIDEDGSGKISFEEYLSAMGAAPPKVHECAAWRRLFRQFDKDGNGYINKEELTQVFHELNMDKEAWEIQRMMEMADKDGDGKLSYEEFISEVFGK